MAFYLVKNQERSIVTYRNKPSLEMVFQIEVSAKMKKLLSKKQIEEQSM